MNTPEKLYELKSAPAVFAVGNKYQIMVMARSELLFWVNVGGKNYYDHSNGVIRSKEVIHHVSVPMSELDSAKEYTINYRRMIERKPYFSDTEEVVSQTYSFKPVSADGPINIYHLSDTHGKFDQPRAAGAYFGDDIDLLILNGDIMDHSGDIKNFDLVYQLCEAITGGSRPVVFSRGNHDTRGIYAEKIADYTPNLNGNSYYTFRLGKIWGIVMDTGEDKPDNHAEYGNTMACHEFRLEEDEFLESVIKAEEYKAPGIEYRLVIVHNPFTFTIHPPFDIEQELFGKWVKRIGETIDPQLFITGHLHGTLISHIGSNYDSKGQTCPVIIGSRYYKNEDKKHVHVGCAITLDGLKADIKFNDNFGTIYDTSEVVELKK